MLKLFARKKIDPKEELRSVLGDFRLPTFPAVAMTALEKARDDDASLSDIADIVAGDPGLTVNIMSTVNSAAFALKHKVRNIHHAVSLLGRNEIESMLISFAVRETLPRGPARGFDSKRFWHTSARRATIGRALAERIDPSTRSESFTASLLQDMAVPVLSHHKGDGYGEVLERWHEDTEDLARLEQEAFGWDHALVATWMCSEWKFPEGLAHAIGAHHGTGDEELVPLPAVSLVSAIREVREEPGLERLVELASERHDIAKEETAALIAESLDSAGELARLFT